MARSAEKATSLFNRWVDQQRSLETLNLEHRPRSANECTTVREVESQRFFIIQQLTQLIGAVQNENLADSRLQKLNDEINNLLRTKWVFDMRLRQLGGTLEAGEPPCYEYFGASKRMKLNDVRVLQAADAAMDVDYYGYRDEEIEPTLRDDEKKAMSEVESR